MSAGDIQHDYTWIWLLSPLSPWHDSPHARKHKITQEQQNIERGLRRRRTPHDPVQQAVVSHRHKNVFSHPDTQRNVTLSPGASKRPRSPPLRRSPNTVRLIKVDSAPERCLSLGLNPCLHVGLVARDECTLDELPRISAVHQHAGYCRRRDVHVVIDVLANRSTSVRNFLKKQLGLLLDCDEHRLAQLRVFHRVVLVTIPPRRIVVVIAGVSVVRQEPRRRSL